MSPAFLPRNTQSSSDIEKITCNKEWILSQIAQRYVEKYQKHKRETDKKQELIAGYLLKEYLGVENDAQLVIRKMGSRCLWMQENILT